jgi:hypothetical protein
MKLRNRLLYIREGCSIFLSVEYIEAELVSYFRFLYSIHSTFHLVLIRFLYEKFEFDNVLYICFPFLIFLNTVITIYILFSVS